MKRPSTVRTFLEAGSVACRSCFLLLLYDFQALKQVSTLLRRQCCSCSDTTTAIEHHPWACNRTDAARTMLCKPSLPEASLSDTCACLLAASANLTCSCCTSAASMLCATAAWVVTKKARAIVKGLSGLRTLSCVWYTCLHQSSTYHTKQARIHTSDGIATY